MSVPKSGWKFEYDYTPEHGSEGCILGPRNELIVEEPGPEATWEHLEHIVKCVNAHPELTARIEELERAKAHDHETLDEYEAAFAFMESRLTLHDGIEFTWLVDGYEVALTTGDGMTVTHRTIAPTLRAAIASAKALTGETK